MVHPERLDRDLADLGDVASDQLRSRVSEMSSSSPRTRPMTPRCGTRCRSGRRRVRVRSAGGDGSAPDEQDGHVEAVVGVQVRGRIVGLAPRDRSRRGPRSCSRTCTPTMPRHARPARLAAHHPTRRADAHRSKARPTARAASGWHRPSAAVNSTTSPTPSIRAAGPTATSPRSARSRSRRSGEPSPESYGFRVTRKAPGPAYTGDTGMCDAVVDLARDADVLLSERRGRTAPTARGHPSLRHRGRSGRRPGRRRRTPAHPHPAVDVPRGRHRRGEGRVLGPVHAVSAGDVYTV